MTGSIWLITKAGRFFVLTFEKSAPATAVRQKKEQEFRILAYTDSSTTERYACCAYIALNDTEGTYLHSDTDFFEQVTSTQAELLSILICVKYLADKHPGCRVSVFSDAQSIVELWNNNAGRLDRINYSDLFIDLDNKVKRFKEFNLVHVSAHSDRATPNKLCDLISRRYRRLHGFMVSGDTD
jgi:ribonuclease HI